MNNKPLLTIAIPTYERCALVIERAKELSEIKDKRIEILIIDNNSTDGTYDALEKFRRSNFRVLSNEMNVGFEGNVNQIFLNANGRWILFLSDEDKIRLDNLGLFLELLGFLPGGVAYPVVLTPEGDPYRPLLIERMPAGKEAACTAVTYTSYISGFTVENLPEISELMPFWKDTNYPQWCAALYAAYNKGLAIFELPLIQMGVSRAPSTITSTNKKHGGIQYWHPLARSVQFKELLEASQKFGDDALVKISKSAFYQIYTGVFNSLLFQSLRHPKDAYIVLYALMGTKDVRLVAMVIHRVTRRVMGGIMGKTITLLGKFLRKVGLRE